MSCSVKRNENGNIVRVEAPNGNESQLYNSILQFIPDKEDALRAWAQVYTPSFKNWFGDWEQSVDKEDPAMDNITRELLNSQNGVSKVVDDNGEPLLVYHGTDNVFDEFKQGYTHPNGYKTKTVGFHFIEEAAKDVYKDIYGEMKPFFLNLNNPLKAEYTTEDGADSFKLEYLKQEDVLSFEARGFDSGIILREGEQEFIAFEANQIKSLFNNGEYSTIDNNVYYQQENISEIPPSEEINKQVTNFLEKIGVSVNSVNVIKDAQGNHLSAIAKADMLNKVIDVVNEAADISTLPEEAAHFFVEMLGPGHPLMKEMMNSITGYKLYPEVVNQYKGNKAYRNQDNTVNFDKIKKEAIGKVIAQFIINNNPADETESKANKFATWFSKVMNFIKSIFTTEVINENPFKYASQKILEGDIDGLEPDNLIEGEFFQLNVGDSINKLQSDQSKLTLDNSIDPITKQKRHIYYYNGEQARGSVTSVYVDQWLKKIFRSDNRTEAQKNLDLLKAEHGDNIHEQMQSIFNSWTNDNGTIRDTQSPVSKILPVDIYNKLNNFAIDILSSYEAGTIIKTEVKVYDKKYKVAGSIDFMAIKPDGTVDILDWKSQEIAKDQTDLKTYKEPMYRIQLENYRKILETEYGFTKFGKIRAIPMKTTFSYKGGNIQGLKDLEIGNFDPTQIPEDKDYLLPVTIKNEKTNDEEVDDLVKRLNGIYDKISNQRYTKDEVYKKREELARFRTALRDLQLRRKVDKLVDLGLLEFKKYSEKLKNGDLSGKDIIDAEKVLAVFNESGTFLYEMMSELQKTSKESGDPQSIAAYNEVKDKFLSMTANTGKLIRDIQKYRDQSASNLAEKEGIFNLLNPEKAIGVWNGLFSSLSKISHKSFRLLSTKLREVQNKRDAKFDADIEKLNKAKTAFTEWSKKKGLDSAKAMETMLNIKNGKWNGNFLNVYKPEFYTLKSKAIKEGDAKWLIDNMTYDEARFKTALEKQIEFFKSIQYNLDELKNEAEVAKKIKEWTDSHQVVDENGKINKRALGNPNNKFLTPNTDWHTEKWTELNKPENKAAKDVYDLFQNMNRRAEQLGMLDNFSPGFIPSIYATKVDQLVFGNVKDIFSGSGFFENLEIDSGSKYTPEIDPTDGSVINRIPVYFTKDMGVRNEETGEIDYSKKSRDLFKVYGVWSAHMNNYEAMESVEDDAMIILEAERNKQSLVTDRFGNIVTENGSVKAANNNDKNAKILEDFINFYLYDQVSGKGSDVAYKLLGKEYSMLKTASAAMQFFSFKTLALNPISGTAQFVGGTANALFAAKKGIFFSEKTWAKGLYLASSSKKAHAAIDYFNTKLEGNQAHSIDALSLSGANKIFTKDNGYFIQRKSDAAVLNPILISMMLNHMIDENGNIVDINKTVKAKYNYNTDFYNLSREERKEIMDKINIEVRELQDKKSLYAVGEISKDGKFSLPGIERDSKTFGDFRNKVKGVEKTIIGNSTKDDINRVRTSMLGMAFMQFRSWIPAMAEERFDSLKYNDELDTYTYGKMNLFFTELFSKRFPAVLKSLVTGFGNDGIQAAKDKYEELRREAFEKGQEFNISEGEFIDLYIGNLKSELLELGVLLGFAASILAVTKATGDDDDKGLKKYLARALKKYYNEVAFYYNPIEFTNLVKSPLPVIGLAEDFFRFSTAVGKEAAGAAFDPEMQESAKPLKYFFKMVPIAKEGMLIMAAHDDQFRKDWDIRIQ